MAKSKHCNYPVTMMATTGHIFGLLMYYLAPCVSMPLTFTQGAMRYSFQYHMNEKAQAIVQLTPAIPRNINDV